MENSVSASVDATPTLPPSAEATPVTSRQVKMPFKSILLGILLLILVGGMGYKWYEWQALTAFARMHNQYVVEELKLMDEINNVAQEMYGNQDEAAAEEEEEVSDEEIAAFFESGGAEIQQEFNDAKNDFAFFNEKYTEYQTLLEEHQAGYSSFVDKRLKYVYGQRADQMKKVAAAMDTYYSTELSDVQHGQIDAQLGFNISEAQKDMLLLQLYSVNTAGFLDDQAVSDNFSDIASLEKYGRDDFKFEREDEIKQNNPYGHETLHKFRSYFKTTYSAIKDIVAGNFDSAGYKFSRLGEEAADIGTIDQERLEDEGKDQRIDRKRRLVESLLARYQAVQELSSADGSDLPVLGNYQDWNQELLACHTYIYKSDLYREVREKYPEAQDITGFVEELNQVSPKTDVVDNSVNKELVSVVNDDKKIEITCKSEEGDEYTLTYQKEVEEDEAEEETEEEKE
ncbi:MAG TPA: hypothetical protein VF209_02865 [Patescibacteria group bacterium]